MDRIELRDQIIALAEAADKASRARVVDANMPQIIALAKLIPDLPPLIIERRSGRDVEGAPQRRGVLVIVGGGGLPPSIPMPVQIPDAVVNIVFDTPVTGASTSDVTLSWDAADGADTYEYVAGASGGAEVWAGQQDTGVAGLNVTLTAVPNGIAIWAGVKSRNAAGAPEFNYNGYTVPASAGGTSTKLGMVTQPAGAVDATVLTGQPSVRLLDASDQAVAESGITVTASLVGTGTLGGTLTANTDANGIATFTNLSVDIAAPPESRQIAFAASGKTGVTSGSLTVNAVSGGGLSVFFNHLDIDGSDADDLMADDFNRQFWYNQNADAGPWKNVAPGWGGNIFYVFDPPAPNGAAVNLGVTAPRWAGSTGSQWVATHDLKANWIGGSNMAHHNLRSTESDVMWSFFTWVSAGYLWSGEKVVSVNRFNDDGGIYWAGLGVNVGTGSLNTAGNMTLVLAGPGPVNDQILYQNQGNNISLSGGASGTWYAVQMRIKLNSATGVADGLHEMWINSGGASGDFSGQTPILRARHTNLDWGYTTGGVLIGAQHFENWANNGTNGSSGERRLADIRVRRNKTVPLGF